MGSYEGLVSSASSSTGAFLDGRYGADGPHLIRMRLELASTGSEGWEGLRSLVLAKLEGGQLSLLNQGKLSFGVLPEELKDRAFYLTVRIPEPAHIVEFSLMPIPNADPPEQLREVSARLGGPAGFAALLEEAGSGKTAEGEVTGTFVLSGYEAAFARLAPKADSQVQLAGGTLTPMASVKVWRAEKIEEVRDITFMRSGDFLTANLSRVSTVAVRLGMFQTLGDQLWENLHTIMRGH